MNTATENSVPSWMGWPQPRKNFTGTNPTRIRTAFDAVAFYRRHMRRAAFKWRKWRDTRCHEYKADALREARYYRDQSLLINNKKHSITP